MKKELMFKAFLMIFLIITLPINIPVVIADSEGVNSPGEQCVEKNELGRGFVDFMDSSVIKAVEMVASILFVVGTLVNTIDFFFTLVSTLIGFQGPTYATTCCISIYGEAGACEAEWGAYAKWKNIKSFGILQGIVSIATCECCSDSGADAKGPGGFSKYAGGAGGLCPLGNLADIMGNKLESTPIAGQDYYNPNSGTGISQFHISAFDNIYMAVGCLCPIAVLFNLRKLKTIYQVRNCCVEQACKNGMTTEICEKQYDEATCMFWEGALIKTIIAVVATIAVGYIAGMVMKWIEEAGLGTFASCALVVLDIVQIPGRIQAMIGAFGWLSRTFNEPDCEDLGFEDIQDQLESGYFSESAGVRTTFSTTGNSVIDITDENWQDSNYLRLDSDGDGIVDSVSNLWSDRGYINPNLVTFDAPVLPANNLGWADAKAKIEGGERVYHSNGQYTTTRPTSGDYQVYFKESDRVIIIDQDSATGSLPVVSIDVINGYNSGTPSFDLAEIGYTVDAQRDPVTGLVKQGAADDTIHGIDIVAGEGTPLVDLLEEGPIPIVVEGDDESSSSDVGPPESPPVKIDSPPYVLETEYADWDYYEDPNGENYFQSPDGEKVFVSRVRQEVDYSSVTIGNTYIEVYRNSDGQLTDGQYRLNPETGNLEERQEDDTWRDLEAAEDDPNYEGLIGETIKGEPWKRKRALQEAQYAELTAGVRSLESQIDALDDQIDSAEAGTDTSALEEQRNQLQEQLRVAKYGTRDPIVLNELRAEISIIDTQIETASQRDTQLANLREQLAAEQAKGDSANVDTIKTLNDQIAALNKQIEDTDTAGESKEVLEERRRQLQEQLEEKEQGDGGLSIQPIYIQKMSVAYNLVWGMTNLLLEEFAYPMIDEMCKADWESSEPATPPRDTHTGLPGTGGPGTDVSNDGTPCSDSLSVQLRISGDNHRITYSMSSCELTPFVIILKSPGSPDYVVEDGFVAPGQVLSDNP